MKRVLVAVTIGAPLLVGFLNAALPAHSADKPPTMGRPFQGTPSTWTSLGNEAVTALLERAANDLHAGRLEQAAAALERALRIEPNNPVIWHYLAQTRLQQGQYEQAETLAKKSETRAGNDAALRARNAWLIAAAHHAASRAIPRAPTADETLTLERRLAEEAEHRGQMEVQVADLQQRLEQERAKREQAERRAASPAPATGDIQALERRLAEEAEHRGQMEVQVADLRQRLDQERARRVQAERQIAEAEQVRGRALRAAIPPLVREPLASPRSEFRRDRERHEQIRRQDAEIADASPARSPSLLIRRSVRHLDVPAGHMPRPGECRIWYPDRPLGYQPPPGDCREISRRVPRGAALLRG